MYYISVANKRDGRIMLFWLTKCWLIIVSEVNQQCKIYEHDVTVTISGAYVWTRSFSSDNNVSGVNKTMGLLERQLW
jgi:hypothetical protein